MTKNTFKIFSYLLITIFLTLGLSISFQSLLAAWVAPTANPPDNNTDEPVNIGSSPQSKLGPLTINFENIAATGLVAYGNVGIGTAAPEKKLTINGGGLNGSGINDVLRLSGGTMTTVNDATGLLFIQRDANNDYGAAIRLVNTQSTPNWLNPRLDFAVQNPNTNTQANIGVKMSILGNGNVGIGNPNPYYKLDVAGNLRVTGVVDAVGGMYIRAADAGRTMMLQVSSSFEGEIYGPSTYGLSIYPNSGNPVAIRVSNTGNVGIGTTNPSRKLEVRGAILVSELTQDQTVGSFSGAGVSAPTVGISNANGAGGIALRVSNLGGSFGDRRAAEFISEGGVAGYFDTNGGTTALIVNRGNVGIGTASPGQKLSVVGIIESTLGGIKFPDGTTQSTAALGGGQWATSGNNINNTNSGNVGIGTAAPGARLNVETSVDNNGIYLKGTSATANAKLKLINDAGVSSDIYTIRSAGGASAGDLWFDVNSGITAMVIDVGGNVGIGTASPGYKLDVSGDLRISGGGAFGGYNPSATHKVTTPTLYALEAQIGNPAGGLKGAGSINASGVCIEGVCQNSWSGIGGTSGWTDDGTTVRLTTVSDKVGIGTAAPSAKLQVNPPANTEGLKIVSSTYSPLVIKNSSDADLLRVDEDGDLSIKGNLTVLAGGSDVAEEFSTDEDYPAGTVLVMANEGYKSARASSQPYDNKVVGVVSDNPALLMGKIISEKKAIVAMVGVIKVKVTTENGEINKGDLLATSATPGHAMKATEGKIGTIIGKALENFTGGRGEIMVLVNLQ